MDRARRRAAGVLRELVWRPTMGLRRQSFRFEGWRETPYIGLRRTGKSCRLRWVNYLHPGLKRSKMTAHEERLVIDLHSKWGNRWSRIARKLPGRTDNEIKNYWRTHMRKKAQEKKKKGISQSSSSSSSSIVSACSNSSSTGGKDSSTVPPVGSKTGSEVEESAGVYSMDEIWRDIELSEESSKLTSPVWDFCATGSLWSMDEEESKMLMQQMGDDYFHSFPFNSLI